MQIIFLRNEKSFYTCKYIGSVQDLFVILYVFGAEKSTKGLVSVKLPLSWKNNTFPSETGAPITVMITTLYYCLVHAPQICSQRQMAWIFVNLYSDDGNK